MINCKDAAKISSELLDHHVPLYRKILLWVHLKACQTCWFYQRQITALRKLLGHYPDTIEGDDFSLPPESQARIKEALKGKL